MDKTRILLLVETSKAFGRDIIQGVSSYASEQGNWTIFLEDRGLLQQELFWAKNYHCHGIISRTSNHAMAKQLKNLHLPYVELLGEYGSDIYVNPKIMGEMASKHFVRTGLKNYAFFSLGSTWWSTQFYEEFANALEKRGFPCELSPFSAHANNLTLQVSLTNAKEAHVIRWLQKLPKPIGIFCPSDSHALFIINLCQIIGIHVPQEIAVLGSENNTPICTTTSPPISSVMANGKTIGYKAAELLDRKIRQLPIPDLPILVPPSYVVTRQSTDLIAVDDPDVSQAIQFIREHNHTRLTVNQVADHVGLSLRTLNRRFMDFLGRSPESEIIWTRMERAKKLLAETNLSVGVIAQDIGYQNSESFIRAFRRDNGMTPKHYRELLYTEKISE